MEADRDWMDNRDASRLAICPDDPSTMAEANAALKHWQAKRAEQQYRQEAGELVDHKNVYTVVFAVARVTRERIMAIPRRLAARLSPEMDQRSVEEILSAELRKALETIDDDAIRAGLQ
jgi:hypothetical protein